MSAWIKKIRKLKVSNCYLIVLYIVCKLYISLLKQRVFLGGEYIANINATHTHHVPMLIYNITKCVDGNKTYGINEKIVRGCDEKCICGEDGKIRDCKPLCTTPYIRAGRDSQDPFCQEEKVDKDGCCAVLVCAHDSGN